MCQSPIFNSSCCRCCRICLGPSSRKCPLLPSLGDLWLSICGHLQPAFPNKLCWKLLDAMVSVYWLRWDLQEEGVVLVIYSCCEWGGLLERSSPGQGSLLANCLFCLVQAHAGKQNWGHFAQKRLAIRPSSWTLQIQFSHASSS